MANFNFVNTAQFRPFSYQEMLQPIAAYTDQYNLLQDNIAESGSKADALSSQIDQVREKGAYNTHQQYLEQIKQQANDLASNGLSPSSRRQLLQLKQNYQKQILPLEQAIQKRQLLAEEERKARLQDNTLEYNNLADSLSLDTLVSNPAYNPEFYSGNQVANQVSDRVKYLTRELRNNPRKWKDILDNQYAETYMKRGFTSGEINKVINNDPDANPLLKQIIQEVIDSTGVANWNNPEALAKLRHYANKGLWAAIGEDQYQQVSNKNWGATSEQSQPQINTLAINPLNIYSQRERSKQYDILNKYKDYFTTDINGNKILTPEGRTKYERYLKEHKLLQESHNKDYLASYKGGFALTQLLIDNPFLESLKALGLDDTATPEDFQKAYNEYYKGDSEYDYDAFKSTEFDYKISESQQQQIKNLMKVAYGNTPIEVVDYGSDGNFNLEKTGKVIKGEDFIGKDVKLSNIRMSKGNISAMITNKDGTVSRIKFPKGVNQTMQTNIASSLKHADQTREDKNNLVKQIQERLKQNPNSNVTPEEMRQIQILDNEYKVLLNNAYFYMSQTLGVNKTKDQDFEQVGY